MTGKSVSFSASAQSALCKLIRLRHITDVKIIMVRMIFFLVYLQPIVIQGLSQKFSQQL